ncbi:hypothetical protein ES703_11826 [subsurface metagenome]
MLVGGVIEGRLVKVALAIDVVYFLALKLCVGGKAEVIELKHRTLEVYRVVGGA